MKSILKSKIVIIAIILLLTVPAIITTVTVISVSMGRQASKQLSLGEKYLLELEYDKAVIAFNKVIEIEPRNMAAYLGLAEAYEGLGKDEEAIKALEVAISIIKDAKDYNNEVLENIEDVYMLLAKLYEENGDREKAYWTLLEGYELIDSNEIANLLKDYYPEIEASVNPATEEVIDISDVETNFYIIDYAKVLRFIYKDPSYIPEVYLNDTNDDSYIDLITPNGNYSTGRMSIEDNKVRIRYDARGGAAGHTDLKYNKELDTYAIDMAYSSAGSGDSVLKICSGLDWKGSEAKMTYFSDNNMQNYTYIYEIDKTEVTSERYSQFVDDYSQVFNKNNYDNVINHFVECDKEQISKIYEAYAEYAQKQDGYIGWSNSIPINNKLGALYVFSYNCQDEFQNTKCYYSESYAERPETQYHFPYFYTTEYPYDYKPILVIAEPVSNGVTFHTVVLEEAFHFDNFEFEKDVLTLSSAEAIRRYTYSSKVIEFGPEMFTYEGETVLLDTVQVTGDVSRLGNNQGNMQVLSGIICYDNDFMYYGDFKSVYRFDLNGNKIKLITEEDSYWFHDLCNVGDKLFYIKRMDLGDIVADYYLCYLDKPTGKSVLLKEFYFVYDTSILNTIDGKIYYNLREDLYDSTTTTFVYDTVNGIQEKYLDNGQLMTEKGIYYTVENETDKTIMFRSFDDNSNKQIIQIDAVPKAEINDHLYLVSNYNSIYRLDLNTLECIKIVEGAYIYYVLGYEDSIVWGDYTNIYLSDQDGNNVKRLVSEDLYGEYTFMPSIVRDKLAVVSYYEGKFYSFDYVITDSYHY
jgi:tetratricopeptide (TPR) repeat protein